MTHPARIETAGDKLELRSRAGQYVRVPSYAWGGFLLASAAGLLTANPWLTGASLLIVPLLVTMLWRKGEIPILLIALGFQWLQVTTKVFHADVLGVDVTALSGSRQVEKAAWLALVGLAVLAVGMRLGLRRLAARSIGNLKVEAESYSIDRVFVGYLVAASCAAILSASAWAVSPATQIFLALAELKWVFFFLLAYLVFAKRERPGYLALAAVYEVFVGLGYFSGFKTPLFFLILALITIMTRPSWRGVLGTGVIAAVLVVAGSAWMNVRADYRAYVSRGTGMQIVTVSTLERWRQVIRLLRDLQPGDLVRGIGPLVERVAYIDYFALAVERVPEVQPHEGGALWRQSIRHVLVPRVLYPDKPVLPSDSELTMRYTGLQLASGAEGTSISLGYMGESYVDFGAPAMFLPIFLLGVLWGAIYAYFMSRSGSALFVNAFAAVVLLQAAQFEVASIKLLGGVLLKFIILALLLRFGLEALQRWFAPTLRTAPV